MFALIGINFINGKYFWPINLKRRKEGPLFFQEINTKFNGPLIMSSVMAIFLELWPLIQLCFLMPVNI